MLAMPAVGVEVAQAGHTERLSAAQWCHPPCVVRDQAKSIVQWYYSTVVQAMVMPQPGHTLWLPLVRQQSNGIKVKLQPVTSVWPHRWPTCAWPCMTGIWQGHIIILIGMFGDLKAFNEYDTTLKLIIQREENDLITEPTQSPYLLDFPLSALLSLKP